jgi:hypothetical protein
MERNSKTINFSLSPQQYDELERLAVSSRRNRSELLRSMITAGLQKAEPSDRSLNAGPRVGNDSLAEILKEYYIARSSSVLKVVVTGLVIAVNDAGEVLIGQRQKPDQEVPNLTWSFPGSRLQSLVFDGELTQAFHIRTGLHVTLHEAVAARVVPESAHSGTQVIALYFYDTVQGEQASSPKPPYQELKWVRPLEVFKHFTSSTTDEVTAFLTQLELKAK